MTIKVRSAVTRSPPTSLTLRARHVMGGATEKVSLLLLQTAWALGPTCAAHSAVQMRTHFPAAHFVDVISSPIDELPGRSCAHRVLHSGHPCASVPRVNRERAGLRRLRPLTRVFFV